MHVRRTTALLLAVVSAAFASAADPAKPVLAPGTVLVEPKIPDTVQGPLRSLNEDLSRGVNPAENAAVHFVQMFGVEVFPESLRDDSLAMMGIESLSPKAARLSGFEAFVRSTVTNPDEVEAGVASLQSQLSQAAEQPWQTGDFPAAEAYLDAHKDALDSVAAIVAIGKYYVPILSEEAPPRIDAAAFDFELRLKAVAPLLLMRAMRKAGAGDFGAAVDELLVCRRLGVLLAEGSPLDISHAKAHVMDGHACVGARTLLEGGRLPPEVAKSYLQRLSTSPSFPTAADAADRGERAALEQELAILEQDEMLVRDYLEFGAGKRLAHLEQTRLKDLDWKAARQRAMEVHDRVVTALRIGPHVPQAESFAALDRDYEAWQARSDELYDAGEGVIDMDVEAASRWVGETLAMSTRGNAWQRRASDDRADVRIAMVKIGLALVAAAGERGGYPASLDELSPAYFDRVPVDAHSEGPFVYGRHEDGSAVLISRGPNRADDANQAYNDDTILRLSVPRS